MRKLTAKFVCACLAAFALQPARAGSPQFPLFDLTGPVDVNGWWLNPRWVTQTRSPPSLPNPYDCPGLEPWGSTCTTQLPWSDSSAAKCPFTVFEYVWFPGHINWGGAVFTGVLRWQDHSGNDDDYTINLVPDNGGSLTAVNAWAILMEFDSDETIDHFHTSWWTTFHDAVDNDNGHMIDGMDAIAFGIIGLDCAHDCHSELHPVFALAIHIKDDPNDDQWAIFVRNWGNEGYCSSGTETLDDSISSFTFVLPRSGASNVTVSGAEFLSRGLGASGPDVKLVRGEGAAVTFGFPPASKRERMNGVLHLQWQTDNGFRMKTESTRWTNAPIDPRTLVEVARWPDPEERFGWLVSRLSPKQRAIYERLRPKHRPYYDDRPLRQADLRTSATRQPLIQHRADAERDHYERQQLEALRTAYGGRIPGERKGHRRSSIPLSTPGREH